MVRIVRIRVIGLVLTGLELRWGQKIAPVTDICPSRTENNIEPDSRCVEELENGSKVLTSGVSYTRDKIYMHPKMLVGPTQKCRGASADKGVRGV